MIATNYKCKQMIFLTCRIRGEISISFTRESNDAPNAHRRTHAKVL